LKFRIGHLYPKGNTQTATPGCIQCQLPDRIEIQAAGLFLHVAPVATDIEDIDKGQAREFVDALFEGFAPCARGKRGTVFLPRISDQTKAGISQRLRGRGGEENRLPALVLIDIERALIETFPRRGSRAVLC
jgi:hypothetical protein